jgi:hypothetical protein
MSIKKAGNTILRVTAYQRIWCPASYLLLIFIIITLNLCQTMPRLKVPVELRQNMRKEQKNQGHRSQKRMRGSSWLWA